MHTAVRAARRLACLTLLLAVSACGLLSYDREALSDYFEAADLFTKAREAQPGSPEAVSLLKEARAAADRSIAIQPFFPLSHKLAIDASRLLGDNEAVRARFAYALSLLPDDTELRIAYAGCLLEQPGGAEEALRLMREGLARDPRNPALRLAYAEILLQEKADPEAAEEQIDLGLAAGSLPPAFFARASMIAVEFAAQGYQDQAAALIRRLAAKSSGGVEQGVLMSLSAGRGDAAAALLQEACREEPAEPSLVLLRVRVLIYLGRTDPAEALLDDEATARAAEAMKDPSFLPAMRAYLLLGAGEARQAVDAFFAVLAEHPESLDALEGLWTAHARFPDLVDPDRLRKAFVKALRAFDDDPATQQRLLSMARQIGAPADQAKK